jgi:TolA protein
MSGKGIALGKEEVQKTPREKAVPIQRFQAREEVLSLKKRQGALPSKQESNEALLEKALAKIERQKPQAATQQEAKPAASQTGEGAAGGAAQGTGKSVSLVNIGGMKGDELSQALALYRALVYEKIESNWVLPDRLMLDKSGLEAVVMVRARRDGTVTEVTFEKKSGDAYFDESVFKAIVKSKPFPPFPDIYSPKEEEIVIRFAPGNERL